MPSILANAEDRLVIDRLYSARQRMLQPTGPLLYQMPTIGTASDGRLLYPPFSRSAARNRSRRPLFARQSNRPNLSLFGIDSANTIPEHSP
jgi:hypothetical protein